MSEQLAAPRLMHVHAQRARSHAATQSCRLRYENNCRVWRDTVHSFNASVATWCHVLWRRQVCVNKARPLATSWWLWQLARDLKPMCIERDEHIITGAVMQRPGQEA